MPVFRSRWRKSASATAASEITSISVPIALMVGVTPKRIADQIRTGSGCGDSPVVK